MRVDLYRPIHKAQRFHLFAFAGRLGRSDWSDPAAVAALERELRAALDHLRDHAANEETYIHPLFRRVGRVADALEHDHHDLDARLLALEQVAAEKRWADLYPAFNRFLAVYLAHLDEEEARQSDALWPHYSDEELREVFLRFKRERSPEASRADLAYLLPALSVPEIVEMFRGMKASAPPASFEAAWTLGERVVERSRWESVAKALAR